MKPPPLYLAFLLVAAPCRGEVIQNVLLDPGFEDLSGTAPDAATSPWFTTGENANESFRGVTTAPAAVTRNIRSGSQAAVMQYYFDAGAIVQNTPLQVASGKTYEFSAWALIGRHRRLAAWRPPGPGRRLWGPRPLPPR